MKDVRDQNGGEKVVVTGGSGFVGRAICEELAKQGYDVHVYDTHPCSIGTSHIGSILYMEDILRVVKGARAVFHIAGILGTHELLSHNNEAIDVNIKGTVNVLEACREAGVQTVFFPTKPNVWLNTYSITKHAAAEFVKVYGTVYNMDVKIVRWLNVYGPGQKAYPVRKAVPLMILQALHDEPVEIFGDGKQVVDLEYIGDIAKTSIAYTLGPPCNIEIVDTGCAKRVTVNQMSELIIDLTGSDSTVKHLPMRIGEPNTSVRWSKLKQIGTIPVRSIGPGMKRTIEYYTNLPQEEQLKALRYHKS